MFESKGLKKNWGCSKTFKTYCRGQIDQYLSDSAGEVDYLAVCLGLRVHIEKCAYDQLGENEQKQFTTETRRTIDKLDFAEVNGAKVPELHYLLAGLYNSALHANTEEWDFLTPVVSKLQNSCIREMIREVFS
jgi:CheY-specific phosphatase CheX